MKRTTLKVCAIGATGLLVVLGLGLFIIEQLDNPGPQVQAPDKGTSFVAMVDLGALVASAKPPALELKPVTSGSGSHMGDFKFDRKPGLHRRTLLHGSTSSQNIEFEITADAQIRAAFLAGLRNAMQDSLSRWQPKVQVSETSRTDGVAAPEGFALEYRAEGIAGDYEGEIKVAIQEVPKENLRRSETGKVIHSLSVATSEDRWGRPPGGTTSTK